MTTDATPSEIDRVGVVAVIRADTAPVRRGPMTAADPPPLAAPTAPYADPVASTRSS